MAHTDHYAVGRRAEAVSFEPSATSHQPLAISAYALQCFARCPTSPFL